MHFIISCLYILLAQDTHIQRLEACKYTFSADPNYEPGADFQEGITTVIYTARDDGGNMATCSFTIELLKESTTSVSARLATDQFRLITVAPNPFSNVTKIRFYVPSAELVQLNIFDLAGRTLYEAQRTFVAGANDWHIAGSQINAKGIYFFTLRTPGGILNGKLVKE